MRVALTASDFEPVRQERQAESIARPGLSYWQDADAGLAPVIEARASLARLK